MSQMRVRAQFRECRQEDVVVYSLTDCSQHITCPHLNNIYAHLHAFYIHKMCQKSVNDNVKFWLKLPKEYNLSLLLRTYFTVAFNWTHHKERHSTTVHE